MGGGADIQVGNIVRFLTVDIVPAPLRESSLLDASSWIEFFYWTASLINSQAFPGIIATVVLTNCFGCDRVFEPCILSINIRKISG